jgi:hypothetical protein
MPGAPSGTVPAARANAGEAVEVRAAILTLGTVLLVRPDA